MDTKLDTGYNPIELSKAVEKLVSMDVGGAVARKYFGFAPTRFYGGSATGYATGCNLRCVYCWSLARNSRAVGDYHKPVDVARKLVGMASQNGYRFARLSGGEPTIAVEHLLQLLDHLNMFRDIWRGMFILETNGILIGYDKRLAEALSRYRFVVARVSIKGCSEEEFHTITGAEKSFFNTQIQAVKNLLDSGIETRVAITVSLCKKETLAKLLERLAAIDTRLVDSMEIEYVKLYPAVQKRLCEKGLAPWIAIKPPDKIVDQEKLYELCRKEPQRSHSKDNS